MFKIDDPQFIELVEKGIPVDRLERRLRPKLNLNDWNEEKKQHEGFGDYSKKGFLGTNERLIEVIHSDWQIVENYGTTHKAIADALDKLILGEYPLHPDYEFMQPTVYTAGVQSCPWGCKASGQNAGVIHKKGLSEDQIMKAKFSQMGGLENMGEIFEDMASRVGEEHPMIAQIRRIQQSPKTNEIFYAPLTGLLPHLIREHYFFEGKQTSYRADPSFLINALNLGSGR